MRNEGLIEPEAKKASAMKNLLAASFLVLLLLSSCTSAVTPLPRHRSFVDIKQVAELAGTYENQGQAGDVKFRSLSLSTILWPLDMHLNHEAIQQISVAEVAPGTLEAKAFSGNVVVKVGRFVENEDFTLKDGRILLRHEAGLAGLQAEEKGQGQDKSSGEDAVAGLAFLIFPVATDMTEEFFYKKLPATKQ